MQATLELLGTGGSHGVPVVGCECETCTSTDPKDTRLRTSALLRVSNSTAQGETAILIDCGPDLRQQALRASISHLSAVLVTHVHADHIFGIDELRVFCRCAPLRLYTSQFWVDDIRKRFPYAFGQVIQKGGGVPKVETVPVAGAFTVDNVPIVPIPVIHGEALTYGYRFGNTAYVTDCNVIPDESYALLSGVEQIVIEGAWSDENTFHMSFVGAINAVERIGAKRAWFTHIYHKTKHAEIQRIIDEELKKRPALVEAGVRIEPGYDGLKITNIII